MTARVFSPLMGGYAILAWCWSVSLFLVGMYQWAAIYFAITLGAWALSRTYRPVPTGKGSTS